LRCKGEAPSPQASSEWLCHLKDIPAVSLSGSTDAYPYTKKLLKDIPEPKEIFSVISKVILTEFIKNKLKFIKLFFDYIFFLLFLFIGLLRQRKGCVKL
jgi:hypothetical protein